MLKAFNNRYSLAIRQAIAGIKKRFFENGDWWNQAWLVFLAGFLRFWRIETPNALVFDEVYFSVYANNYLEGVHFFDSHPPLGKYLIAIGIRFFGFIPLGYRCMDALFGIGIVILIYRLGKLLFADRRVGFLAGLFAALDGVLLVESRAGLINTFAVFFSLAAYYLFLRAGGENPAKPRWIYLAGAGICIGAGIAVKWIGVASLWVIFISYLAAKSRQQWKFMGRLLPDNGIMQRLGNIHPDLFLLCCAALPAAVYAASFIIHHYPFAKNSRISFF
jgi:dolichyl-phosphate-mannose--protein O-mannosyl transferase